MPEDYRKLPCSLWRKTCSSGYRASNFEPKWHLNWVAYIHFRCSVTALPVANGEFRFCFLISSNTNSDTNPTWYTYAVLWTVCDRLLDPLKLNLIQSPLPIWSMSSGWNSKVSTSAPEALPLNYSDQSRVESATELSCSSKKAGQIAVNYAISHFWAD